MSAEAYRTCPSCGNEFSGAMEFCPVCMLRGALPGAAESGASSFEEAVKPTLEQAVQRFEHYELVMGEDGKPVELGRGAMGVTYKAFDINLRCPVTLKVINERYLGDESARLRFLREARVAASVRHQNVASVLHLGRTGSSYFYAMEFVEEETLEKLIKRTGRLDVKLALEIATQVAAGLAAIHERNLVHRDIKPTNIMVRLKEEDGSVTAKIIDLGLAKTVDESASEAGISLPGTFAGTPEFASPDDAPMNKRLWGASYDREMKDIFAIQSDVAEQIAAALQATLSADERASIRQKPTENVAAYDLYLRGWGLYQLYQKDENEKAIDLFKQALEADPKFALAYTGLADAYIERVQRFHGEDFWSDSAIDLCEQAVALDPKEVRSYTELARAFLNKGWDERAHEPIRRALELNPNDWRANRFAADELFGTGRYDEMYLYLRKCFAVNPNDSYAPNLLGYICWTVGQNDLAAKWMQRAIDVETDLQGKLIMERERSVLRGDYAKAARGLEQLPPGFYSYTFSASGLLIDCMVHLKDWPGLLQLIAVLKQAGDTQKGRNPATLLMPEAIALRALERETEARQTVEHCETIARNDLVTKKYDEHWNHWILAFCARFLGRKEEAYQNMRESFVNGDVAFLGWLPDGPSLQIFKADLSSKPLLLSGRNRTLENAPGSSQSKRVINSETFDLLADDLNFGHLRFLRMVISWIRQSFRGFDRLLTQPMRTRRGRELSFENRASVKVNRPETSPRMVALCGLSGWRVRTLRDR
jgi:serine/threonine protein kinase